MSVTLVHPEQVHRVDVHHQVADTQGSRTVYLAGQVSWDTEGNLVGAGDLAAQAEKAYLNIAAALDAVGATMADLAKVTVYVVDLDAEKAEQFVVGRERAAAKLGVELQQPSTWIGVTALAAPGYLVEVDAVAVLP
ncbi:RidA family protein [Promicromonospora thailandica]|uniref:Enamine deaminase RidA, house cleaning of reactive enamine intermediates, YjgF/YER057c/UK114 family n=1 Tax=Promicromonospora thailandica TaxID=765201 RepID=A0A9X2G7M7_9MICO|nr:RidA family protein [Promicromonospora thailandica]MCP2267073.1 Enamine deaminase RidA, house cleaning of reactive enamine intermediates, YjgF/YER057c/UK114 family [Promicromonospora thailandica]BFF16648.1 RidA family protein [Promicromonospora thailandica]